jgi:hypothetical protein
MNRIVKSGNKRPRKKKQSRQAAPEVIALMRKVKRQLERLMEPLAAQVDNDPRLWRGVWTDDCWNPTVFDYAQRDMAFRSTMTGGMSGRTAAAFKRDFPKSSGILEWVRKDLQRWPWKARDHVIS